MDTTEIGQLIARTGLKRQEIAAAIGASVASLRRWERGDALMPGDKLENLKTLAGGRSPLRLLEDAGASTATLARIPTADLIEELARRARGGTLQDTQPAGPSPQRALRSVAFKDIEDD